MGLSLRNIHKGLGLKINKCLDLLEKEYKDLNYTIYFYEKPEKLEKERRNKPDLNEEQYNQILAGQNITAGITIGEKGIIKIFLFLYEDVKKNPKEVIDLIGNLYHEIRHAWQAENKMFEDEEEISILDGNLESYYSLPSEKDAYKFQEEQMKLHGKKILEIFGYSYEFKYELNKEIRDIIYS